ncbi:MucR family transcriptional regulator [Alsobacter sp. SYSU M60028]|uniref:MucR family transcriptional regulator n=1 Tax=Alsobacter ponti TaxID=2962936 RepID=A0ABT1L9M9_9HYPH|nr:MucR family transcriptional regulator [Alsobacter ponti]MCP8938154.1 MucR family transcriptional regulator [Alsobacter ponti]
MDDKSISGGLVEHAATIVAAYVSNNSIPASGIAALIASVHSALNSVATAQDPHNGPAAKPAPPVPIRKSVTPDYLVSLEDGQRYKSLKRHLAGRGLTPEQYREKWGLPSNYPMVAPNYAKQRSELAKAAGLGKIRVSPSAAKTAAAKPRAAKAPKA